MKLDKSPFVVVSVIGQELLTAGHHGASVVVLEAALKIGTCSLKLRGSVFSALSSAYWSLGNTEKSTGYMQQDLDVAKTLGKSSPFTRLSAGLLQMEQINSCVNGQHLCNAQVSVGFHELLNQIWNVQTTGLCSPVYLCVQGGRWSMNVLRFYRVL